MERKGGSSTAVVTTEQVKASLQRSTTLTSEEEKALRMRHGAKVEDLRAPLPRAAGTNAELGDELLLIEMQLLRSARARGKVTPMAAAPPQVGQSRTKDKIVRALRKKR
jgi:hypothetical protein